MWRRYWTIFKYVKKFFRDNIKFTKNYKKLSILIYLQYLKYMLPQWKKGNSYYEKWFLSEKNLLQNSIKLNYNKGLIYYQLLKGFIGRSSNYHNQFLFHSKIISYQFSPLNNLFNLFGSSDKLNKLIIKI